MIQVRAHICAYIIIYTYMHGTHLIDGYEHPCGGLQGEVSHERQRQSDGSATSIFLTRMNNLMDWVTAWILGENWASCPKQVRPTGQAGYPEVSIESFVGHSSMVLLCPLLCMFLKCEV